MNEEFNKAIKDNNLDLAISLMKESLLNLKDNKITNAALDRRISNLEVKLVKNKKLKEKLINEEGWRLKNRNKKSWTLEKEKVHNVWFEEYCWAIFAKLGFIYMNNIDLNPDPHLSFQIIL